MKNDQQRIIALESEVLELRRYLNKVSDILTGQIKFNEAAIAAISAASSTPFVAGEPPTGVAYNMVTREVEKVDRWDGKCCVCSGEGCEFCPAVDSEKSEGDSPDPTAEDDSPSLRFSYWRRG